MTTPAPSTDERDVLRSLHSLDPACVEEVARTGHTVVRGLAPPAALHAVRAAVERAATAHAAHTAPLDERDTYGKAFLQIPNLWTTDATISEFVRAPRFAHVAASLLGVDAVRLYHDQALVKEAGGGLTPWHQDQVYWPLATDRTITMWMPLVDVADEIGTMTFADGSHLEGDLGRWVIGDESEAGFERVVRERGLACSTHGALRAGDATFHLGWTLHRAPANPSTTTRTVMTVIYYADGTLVGPLDSVFRQFDAAAWLGGAAEGMPAAGPANPVLWPATEAS